MCNDNGDGSGVVLLHEFEVFIEGNSATFVSIDLVEIPLHHFLSDLDLQGFEGIFHQSPELSNVDELILPALLLLLGAHRPLSEEMSELNVRRITYSSKVILPSPF